MQTPIQTIIECYLEQKEDQSVQPIKTTSEEITKLIQAVETMDNIKQAANTLCKFCENDECEYCIVQKLADDATTEAIDAGWTEE